MKSVRKPFSSTRCTFRTLAVLAAGVVSCFNCSSKAYSAELYMAGDSIMAEYHPSQWPQYGWGQALQQFMKEPRCLHNFALSGWSARRFRETGRWNNLIASKLRPGDWVIVSFGHNDMNKRRTKKPKKDYSTIAEYKAFLKGFAADVRSKGANIAFATSIAHSKGFSEKNGVMTVDGGATGLGPYVNAMREVASSLNAPLLDLNRYAETHLPKLGMQKAKSLYMFVRPGEYSNYPTGKKDAAHVRDSGAFFYAKAAVEMANEQGLSLAGFFKSPAEVPFAPSVAPAPPGQAKDYFKDAAFRREYREAAIKIAKRKIASDEEKRAKSGVKTPFKVRERISTGGGFSGFFVWDAAFGVLWGRYVDGMPVHGTLDNFYALQQPDGFICREYDGSGRPMWRPNHPGAYNPPILAWAEIELYRSGKSDKARLEKVYPKLVKFHECYEKNLKRADGLYFSDILGCGMDDLKRWPHGMSREDLKKGGIEFTKDNLYPWSEKFWGRWMSKIVPEHTWNRQAAWIDMSAQMAFDCLNLADIATVIGKNGEAAAWKKEHARIAALVNEKCWDEKTGFYYDYCDKGLIMRKHAGAFWVLLAKIPTPARAKRMAATMTDPRYFGRTIPVPALAADDPDYKPLKGYWQGPVWPPTTYVAICGLRACGETEAARKIAHGWYNGNAEYFIRYGTVFENIMPDYEYIGKRRHHSGRDFCGWGALAPIAIPAEWK